MLYKELAPPGGAAMASPSVTRSSPGTAEASLTAYAIPRPRFRPTRPGPQAHRGHPSVARHHFNAGPGAAHDVAGSSYRISFRRSRRGGPDRRPSAPHAVQEPNGLQPVVIVTGSPTSGTSTRARGGCRH